MDTLAVSTAAPYRRVPTGRGLDWIKDGWALVMKRPEVWLVMTLVALGIYAGLYVLLLVGHVLGRLLAPVFLAGQLMGARSLDNGGPLGLDYLFLGFRQATGRLLAVGVACVLAELAPVLILLLGAAGLAAAGTLFTHPLQFVVLAVSLLFGAPVLMAVAGLLALPLLMAIWFATPLVIFRDMAPLQALRLSFVACLVNTGPFLVFGLFFFLAGALVVATMGLALVVAIPLFVGCSYASYKDIFE